MWKAPVVMLCKMAPYMLNCLTLNFQDLIINSPYSLPQNSYDVCLENVVLYQLVLN